MPRVRRDIVHIVTNILDVARDGAGKTDIMYKAKLSFAQLDKYLPSLEEVDLLEKMPCNKPDRPSLKQEYRTTKEGIKFLNDIEFPSKKLKELENLL